MKNIWISAIVIVLAGVSAAAETPATTQTKDEEFERAAKQVLDYIGNPDHTNNARGVIVGLGMEQSDKAPDRLIEWYQSGKWPQYRGALLEAIAIKSTPKTRAVFLKLIKTRDIENGNTNRFLCKNFLDYSDAAQKELAELARKVLAGPFVGEQESLGSVAAVWLLGLNSDPNDLPLLAGVSKTIEKNVHVAGYCRPMLARLGDEKSHAAILAELEKNLTTAPNTRPSPENLLMGDPDKVEGVARTFKEIAYIARKDDIQALLKFLDDQRVTGCFPQEGNATTWMNGRALDGLAAEAIYQMIHPAPQWPLTAPEGKVKGIGKHPLSGETDRRDGMRFVTNIETLSPEQRAEIRSWAKESGIGK